MVTEDIQENSVAQSIEDSCTTTSACLEWQSPVLQTYWSSTTELQKQIMNSGKIFDSVAPQRCIHKLDKQT